MTFDPSTTVTDAAVDDSIDPTTDARPSSAICAATTNGPLRPSMPIATVNDLVRAGAAVETDEAALPTWPA